MNIPHTRLLLGLLLLAILAVALRAAPLHAVTVRNRGVLAFNQSIASSLFEQDQVATVESRLEAAVTLNPTHRSTQRLLGYTYLTRGQEGAALAAWRKAGAMGPELVDRGRELEEQGLLDDALNWYERATLVQPELPDSWRRTGAMLERSESWQAAIEIYAKGAVASDSSDLYFLLANTLLQHTEPVNWRNVLKAADQAISLDNFAGDYNASQVHYIRGVALLELDQPVAAQEALLTVLETQPDHYWTNIRLGRLAWESDGQINEAENYLRAAIDSNRNVKWAYRDLAALMLATGREADAADLLTRVLELDPGDSTARDQLAELQAGN